MALLSDKFKLKPQLSGADVKSLYEAETDTNAYTDAEKTKLAGIADGAEVNVNADWNAVSGDSQILNKPTLGTAAATDSTDYATAAQGTLADTALQPDQAETISGNYTFNGALFLPNNSRISGVEHFYQPDKPTHRGNDDVTALVPGDRWYKTNDGTEWYWNGTYWISTNINYTGGRRTSGNSAPNFTESTEWDYSQGRLVLIRTASVSFYLGSAGDTNNYIYFGVMALLRNAGSISLYNSTNKMFSSGVNSIVDEAVSVVVLKDYSTVNVVGLYFNLYTVGSPPPFSGISGSIAWSLIYE